MPTDIMFVASLYVVPVVSMSSLIVGFWKAWELWGRKRIMPPTAREKTRMMAMVPTA